MKWTTEETGTFRPSTKLGFWCYNKGRFVVHVGSMQSQCSNVHQWPTSWWAFTFIDGLCEADCPFKHTVLLVTESLCEREWTGCVSAGSAASPFKHSLDDLVSAIKHLPQPLIILSSLSRPETNKERSMIQEKQPASQEGLQQPSSMQCIYQGNYKSQFQVLAQPLSPCPALRFPARVNVPSWRSWTTCVTWLGCRYSLVLPLMARTLSEHNRISREV